MKTLYLNTPIGPIAMRKHVQRELESMSDAQVAGMCFLTGFIMPEAFRILEERRLVYRGDYEKDIYRRIIKRCKKPAGAKA